MTDSSISYPPLVVWTDPVGASKALRPSLIQILVLAAAFLAALITLLSLGRADGAVVFACVLGIMASIAYALALTHQIGAVSNLRPVLTLDQTGIHARVNGGELDLPWETVRGIRVRRVRRHSILAFELEAGTSPSTPGIRSTISARNFAYIARRGFQIGSVAVSTPVQTILDATSSFTDQRVLAREG